MAKDEFYESAKVFFNDIFRGFVSIDLWKGFEELLRYYKEEEESIHSQNSEPVDEEYYKKSSPKYEAIMQELQRKNISSSNEPIISVGNMFKMLNPRLYMQYAQLMAIPAYSQEHQIQPLEDIVEGRYGDLYMDDETIQYIESNIPFYKERLEMMKKSFNPYGRAFGYAITSQEPESEEEKDTPKKEVLYDGRASQNEERFYGNINDGITLAHESEHNMELPYISPMNLSEQMWLQVLAEIPSILIEKIMADYYETPCPAVYALRKKAKHEQTSWLGYTTKNFEKLISLLSQNKIGNNRETDMLLYSLHYDENVNYYDYLTFSKHVMGDFLATYIYEKILEDPSNFKMYLGIKKALSMGSIYSGPSIELFKRLGIPIVDSDGKLSLNQENVTQIIESHNKYLTGKGPKHLNFTNLSEPMIPDSIFEEVDQLSVDIMHEYQEKSGVDGTTLDEVQSFDVNHPVRTYSELLEMPLSKEDIYRIRHLEVLGYCRIDYEKNRDTISIDEIKKIKHLLPKNELLCRLVYGEKDGVRNEELLKKIIELGITEEELFSINDWISIEAFIPNGNIQTLSKEEQRLIFYNDARGRLSFRGTNRKFKILRFSRVGPS